MYLYDFGDFDFGMMMPEALGLAELGMRFLVFEGAIVWRRARE